MTTKLGTAVKSLSKSNKDAAGLRHSLEMAYSCLRNGVYVDAKTKQAVVTSPEETCSAMEELQNAVFSDNGSESLERVHALYSEEVEDYENTAKTADVRIQEAVKEKDAALEETKKMKVTLEENIKTMATYRTKIADEMAGALLSGFVDTSSLDTGDFIQVSTKEKISHEVLDMVHAAINRYLEKAGKGKVCIFNMRLGESISSLKRADLKKLLDK